MGLLWAAVASLLCTHTLSAVLNVCPTCTYILPSQAVAAAQDNDIVQIQAPSQYFDCFFVRQRNLTVEGVGGRAVIAYKTCGGKAIIVNDGDGTTLKSLDLSGMYSSDMNGAGVRHEVGRLTVIDCYIHDGQEGILTNNDPTQSLYIYDSEFARLGTYGPPLGQAHGIYVGKIARADVVNSYFHDITGQGHEVKSRAMETNILCNTIASLDGEDSRCVDLPNGGNVTIYGNVIEKGPDSSNGQVIGYAMEVSSSGYNPIQSLSLFHNTFISDCTTHVVTHVAMYTTPAQGWTANTNTFVAGDHIVTITGVDQSIDSTNTVDASRSAAGLGPYPSLPSPLQCKEFLR